MHSPASPPQPKQSERRNESVLTHVFHDGRKNDVLSSDVVAIYMASNQPGDDDGLLVFQHNPKSVLQPQRDPHGSTENKQES